MLPWRNRQYASVLKTDVERRAGSTPAGSTDIRVQLSWKSACFGSMRPQDHDLSLGPIPIIPSSLIVRQQDYSPVSWVHDAPSPSGKAEDFDSSIAGSTPAGAIYMRIWWNGRHARLRIWCFGVWVRCPLSAPRSQNGCVPFVDLLLITIIPSSPVMVQQCFVSWVYMQRSYNGQYIVLPSRWSGFDSHSLLHRKSVVLARSGIGRTLATVMMSYR